MGHQRLGTLPRSKRWTEVVALLGADAGVPAIAAASAHAAEATLPDVSSDPAVRHSFWLLTQIPAAARQTDFAPALATLGLQSSADPSLAGLISSAMDSIDDASSTRGGRSDYGEMAQLAFAEALHAVCSREPDLLGDGPDHVQRALAKLASPKQFTTLARDFFARLTRRHLAYFLSRELVNHTGPDQRFSTLRQQAEFDAALDQHCRETTRIIRDFAAEWLSKQTFEGGIDRAKAGRFVHVATRKIRDELRQRSTADA